MSKRNIYLFGILFTIGIGTLLYNYMCCKACCQDNSTKNNATDVSNKNFVAGDNNKFSFSNKDFNFNCNDNFKFLSNDFKSIQPVNDSINIGIGLLKTNLNKNKDKIIITGYALNSEKNTSSFPNLALARAHNLKDYFVSKGIASDRFELKDELRNILNRNGDTIFGSASFRIIKGDEVRSVKSEDWEALRANINTNPLILHFNSWQSEINLSALERQKVADLIRYLDNVKEAKINVVGHTDDAGNRNANVKLGLNRANFAKDYLSKNGISAEKINTISKGANEPIANNKTDNGKAKTEEQWLH